MRSLILGSVELEAIVERELAPLGYSVTRAADVKTACAILGRERCRLVIVDWSLPDAAASCRALADRPECAESVLVAITDERAPEPLAAVFAAGAADALPLPEGAARLAARALQVSRAAPNGAGALYRMVFERNPLAVALIDDETLRFLAVSDGAVEQYGWSREEFLGLTLRDIRPAEALPALETALQMPDPSFLLTTTHRRKDGSEFISRGIIQRITSGDQRVRFALSRDVTAEVRAEEAHGRSLAAYQSLVERLADGVITHAVDDSCAIRYANPAFASFLGYASAAELAGRPVLDVVHPDDRELVRGRIRGIADTGRPSLPRAVRFLARDGSVRWAETRGISTGLEDEARAITVIVRDLTERREAEQTLRLSEERFSRLFQANPAAISITRLSDGRFLDVNRCFEQVTGFLRAEVLGKTGTEMGLWETPATRDALYAAVKRSGPQRDVEVRLRRKDGARAEVLMSTEVVEVGGERCMLALAIDISERKRLDEQLRHAQKMEAIGRLAGGIAHDFNNLLTGIRGYSEVLIELLPPGSSSRDAAQHIQRSALRAASLTGQLLVFTRRQPMQPAVVVLDDIVSQMGAMLRRIIGGDIALELHLDAAGCKVRVDPTQLEQVILNLVVNARDAMPRGGHLVISSGSHDAGGRRWVRLDVSDDGTGMDEEVRARIFEPFFTTKQVGRGTGLGLSIVYGIVEQSGGTISVDTAVGRGTTFHIALPRVDAPADTATIAPPPGQTPRGHERILLVEDDEDVRDFVEFVLRRAGYDVLVADDGARALELARAQAGLQLLVSDVRMPRMSGHDLAVELRRERPGLKVLHISGYPGSVGAGPAEPSTAFLQKPFSAEELLRRVRATLEEP